MTLSASVALSMRGHPFEDVDHEPAPAGGARTALGAGLHSGDRVIDAMIDWHCPQPDIRGDLIRRTFQTLWDGLELLAPLPAGPCLFLTNHQTSLDILLFSYVISALRSEPVNLVGWRGMLQMHSGALLTRTEVRDEPSAYHLNRHVHPHYIDTRKPDQILAAARRLQAGLADPAEAASAILAAEGMRQFSDGEPIKAVSASFIDIARAARVPVVPVRFVWGLPGRALPYRTVWPADFAPQRFVVGAPIPVEALDAVPLRDRAEMVRNRIDALWRPAPPGHRGRNIAMAGRIGRIMAMTGMSQTNALMCDLLLSARPDDLSDEGRLVRHWLCDIGAAMHHKADDWLFRFAMWLSDGFGIAHTMIHDEYMDLPPRR